MMKNVEGRIAEEIGCDEEDGFALGFGKTNNNNARPNPNPTPNPSVPDIAPERNFCYNNGIYTHIL